MQKLSIGSEHVPDVDCTEDDLINSVIKATGVPKSTIYNVIPYHPELNPIEEIWGFTKRRIASRNVTQTKTDTLNIIKEEFSKVTSGE